MQKIAFSLFLLFSSTLLPGQSHKNIIIPKKYSPRTTTISYKIGDRVILIKLYHYGDNPDPFMLNLHDVETTSVLAARRWLELNGGLLIKFENDNQRTISFPMRGIPYAFDPNRMFSRKGIIATLKDQGGYMNNAAIEEIEKFAARVLQLVPENPSCIIALHNNGNGNFSVTSYLPGNDREKDARLVYADPRQDIDDIFLTTDSLLYTQLAAKKYNSIWQDNVNVRQDGSLSVYCGEKGIRYLNCETQHGKTALYLEMLKVATTYIERVAAGAVLYKYSIEPDEPITIPAESTIYFGDKKVGLIKSIYKDDLSNGLYGKFTMDKNFSLYSNMDFFVFLSPAGKPRIEVRIDPTRERKRLDLLKSSIRMILKKQP